MDTMLILQSYKKELEKDGYKVLYIGLFGSQNYGVHDDNSDVDARAIVLPNIDDLVNRRDISFKKVFTTGECDVKDLLSYYKIAIKGNFAFLELFYTKYFIGDLYLKCLFRDIPLNKMSVLGTMKKKREKINHICPSKEEIIKRIGYDPKEYHHIIRLYDLLMFNNVHPNIPYLKYSGNSSQHMINIKRGNIICTVEEVIYDIDTRINIVDNKLNDYIYNTIDFESKIISYIKEKILEEIKKEMM